MKRLQIVYHGTSYKSSKSILKEGFREGTYFAKYLEDALGYGGKYIFEVAYQYNKIPKKNWQFICEEKISPEFIVRLTKYEPSKIIKDDKILRVKICMSNMTDAEREYMFNNMKNNKDRYTKEELIAYGLLKE